MMSPGASEEFLRVLETARADFAVALPARIDGIERGWRELAPAPSAQALAELAREAHGLAGSGGMFGFDRVSTTARTLELALQGLAPLAAAAPAAREGIEAALAGLRAAAGPAQRP